MKQHRTMRITMFACLVAGIAGVTPALHIPESAYERMHAVDFSREILSVQAGRLLALRMDFVGWNDLGHPERVMDVLRSVGFTPSWMREWQAPGRAANVATPRAEAAVA